MSTATADLVRTYRNIPPSVSQAGVYLSYAILPFVAAYYSLVGAPYLLVLIPLLAFGATIVERYWARTPKPVRFISIVSIFTLLGWAVMTATQPAHAFFFGPLEDALNNALSVFGVSGLDQIPGWLVGFLKFIALAAFGIIIALIIKARDDEDETRRNIQKMFKMVLIFALGAAMITTVFV
jgi:hypothetical protein